MIGVTVESVDDTRKAYGGVDGLRVGDIPEYPANAAYVVHILFP